MARAHAPGCERRTPADGPPLVAAVSGGEWARVTALAIFAEKVWLRGEVTETLDAVDLGGVGT